MIIDKLGAGHYQTNTGLSVVILCLDAPGNNPVIGYVIDLEGKACSAQWTKNGSYYGMAESSMDLIPVPRKPREVWLYANDTLKEALQESKDFVAAVKTRPGAGLICFREVMEDENA